MLSIKEAVRRIKALRENAARRTEFAGTPDACDIEVKRCPDCGAFHDLDQELCPTCDYNDSTKFLGFQDHPTWAAHLWLTNVEKFYVWARKWASDDITDEVFARKCASMLLRQEHAMHDINPSGLRHRWDTGLKHSINWSQIRDCLRD